MQTVLSILRILGCYVYSHMTKNLLIVTRHCCLYLYGVYLGGMYSRLL